MCHFETFTYYQFQFYWQYPPSIPVDRRNMTDTETKRERVIDFMQYNRKTIKFLHFQSFENECILATVNVQVSYDSWGNITNSRQYSFFIKCST